MKKIKFTKAINMALHKAMSIDEKVICFGLGVIVPKTIFSSTNGF